MQLLYMRWDCDVIICIANFDVEVFNLNYLTASVLLKKLYSFEVE